MATDVVRELPVVKLVKDQGDDVGQGGRRTSTLVAARKEEKKGGGHKQEKQ